MKVEEVINTPPLGVGRWGDKREGWCVLCVLPTFFCFFFKSTNSNNLRSHFHTHTLVYVEKGTYNMKCWSSLFSNIYLGLIVHRAAQRF